MLRQAVEHDDPAALDRSIELLAASVNGTTDPADRHGVLSNLAAALQTRFERRGASQDLDKAIEYLREAIGLRGDDDPQQAPTLSNLGNMLRLRMSDSADIDEAVVVGRRAVDLTPVGDPDRGKYLHNLSLSLSARFALTGESADIDEAVAAGQKSVDATARQHPRRAARLAKLAEARWQRQPSSGTPRDHRRR